MFFFFLCVPQEIGGKGGIGGNSENSVVQASEQRWLQSDPSYCQGRYRYLHIVVLGASHHEVMLVRSLGDCQAHHCANVAGQFADGLEPTVGRGSTRDSRLEGHLG